MTTSHSSLPRWINLLLGIWLFISAFAWPHATATFTNTWIVGIVIAAIAGISILVPPVHWANGAVAVYLFFSTVFMAHALPVTPWHNAILAVIVFFLSLIPAGQTTTATPHEPAHVLR